MVPFVAALSGALLECQLRATRPRIATAIMTNTQAQFEADIKLMIDTALARTFFRFPCWPDLNPTTQVVQQRRENPTDPDAPKDLLDRMLTVADTKTGEQVTDESIVDNVRPFLWSCKTFFNFGPDDHFLIIGHKTTTGTLSPSIR